jgi:hypothetical protein
MLLDFPRGSAQVQLNYDSGVLCTPAGTHPMEPTHLLHQLR